MKNWWYYHKWYVICGILILFICIDLAKNAFGWFEKTPDIQIAYVGESLLPTDTVEAVQDVFSSLVKDYNHDGEIIVQVNQFIDGTPKDAETAEYQQASELKLIGDINDCESYFFLLENPDDFQKDFQILAMPNGSCPDTSDLSTDNKVFQWESCSLLSEKNLGSYSVTLLGQQTFGNNQEILSKLYIGRRYFYDKKHSTNLKECNQLWNKLKEGVKK